MKVKAENYIAIQGWMRTELDLSGNDLLVYAIIYSFSQDEESYFNGSLQYLADWCGATKQGILKNIKKLTDKGLIYKDDHGYYAVTTIKQSLTQNDETIKQSLTTIKQSLTNNISNNKKINNKTISKDIVENFLTSDISVKPKKQSLWDKCVSEIDNFTDDVILREYLIEYLKKCLENSREAGRPMYLNNFKGKLNKLKQLSTDNHIQRKIVLQTLDNGWNAFYELKEEKQYRKKDVNVFGEDAKVKSEAYTDDELEEEERINKERERKGLRVKF